MLKTLSYVYGNSGEEIKTGGIYYFGQLWNGDGDGDELLESGCIAIWDEEEQEEEIIDFKIAEKGDDIMQTKVFIK